MNVLVTGSSGLIGSEMVTHFDASDAEVHGVDNNMRADFFGPAGDTSWNLARLQRETSRFVHHDLDVRDREGMQRLFRERGPFDLIIHCAAQPSHDLGARRPLDDWDVNAGGTINVLEATRRHSEQAVFVLMSTNKVYGDAPNELPLIELPTRWEFESPEHRSGIPESMRIDTSQHSVMGASKLAADIMTQEYGRAFGLKTHCLRGGCLTGPNHSGVELHGFLSYLVKSHMSGDCYTIFGYGGKQVRDNIHSYDVARAVEAILDEPRAGEVYNLGGGPENSCSILEAFDRLSGLTRSPALYSYVDEARRGDHICYYSDMTRFRNHYPAWRITRSLDAIFEELVDAWKRRIQG